MNGGWRNGIFPSKFSWASIFHLTNQKNLICRKFSHPLSFTTNSSSMKRLVFIILFRSFPFNASGAKASYMALTAIMSSLMNFGWLWSVNKFANNLMNQSTFATIPNYSAPILIR